MRMIFWCKITEDPARERTRTAEAEVCI